MKVKNHDVMVGIELYKDDDVYERIFFENVMELNPFLETVKNNPKYEDYSAFICYSSDGKVINDEGDILGGAMDTLTNDELLSIYDWMLYEGGYEGDMDIGENSAEIGVYVKGTEKESIKYIGGITDFDGKSSETLIEINKYISTLDENEYGDSFKMYLVMDYAGRDFYRSKMGCKLLVSENTFRKLIFSDLLRLMHESYQASEKYGLLAWHLVFDTVDPFEERRKKEIPNFKRMNVAIEKWLDNPELQLGFDYVATLLKEELDYHIVEGQFVSQETVDYGMLFNCLLVIISKETIGNYRIDESPVYDKNLPTIVLSLDGTELSDLEAQKLKNKLTIKIGDPNNTNKLMEFFGSKREQFFVIS